MKTFNEILENKLGTFNYQTYFDILTPELRQIIVDAADDYAEQQVKNLNKPAVIGSLPNVRCSLCNFETDSQINLLRHHHNYHS